MTQVVEEKHALAQTKKIINSKLVTTIANSRDEHSIHTYSTNVDTHYDIKAPGFFNPLYTFVHAGDIVRVFRYENKKLNTYYEFIVYEVDTITKQVTMALLSEKNIQKAIITESKA